MGYHRLNSWQSNTGRRSLDRWASGTEPRVEYFKLDKICGLVGTISNMGARESSQQKP